MARQLSLKRIAISKDNAAIVGAIGVTTFVVVFSLVASQALVKQLNYHNKVIGKKKTALNQLKKNAKEVETLKNSYKVFADAEQNIIEGTKSGTTDRDGENPRIVLDALPSKYDFPALTASLAKLFQQYGIDNIKGTDDEVAQSALQPSGAAQPVEVPFSITVKSTPQSTKEILKQYERSIRPIQINKLVLNGQANDLKMTVDAVTYFQPQKKFEVKTEKVK